jgi:cell division protein FtsW (lipid II flippase)
MTRVNSTPTARRERILLLIATALVLVGALTLAIPNRQSPISLLLAVFAWIVSFAGAHFFLSRHLPNRDPLLLPTAALLTGLGLLLIERLAINFLLRQSIWLVISIGVLAAIIRLSHDLRWLRRFRYTWLFGGLVLLATTLFFGVNPSGYGPRLWLGALGIYFQPAELLKLLLIAYMASYLAERKELLVIEGRKLGRWRLPPLAYVGPLLAMFGLAVVLQAWQQDLGAAMLFFFTFLAMLYLATGQRGYVIAGLAMFVVVGVAGYVLSDKVALRVDGWLNPWPEAAGRAFQIVQSLQAFGAGGIFGRGLGLGDPTYIPAVHTDFVFAAIGEELGLAGALAVIALYGTLMLRGFRVAVRASHPFERLLAAGLSAGLAIQAWVIMAGNARLAPIAGVTLPFISYGGSSILTSFISLALLLRISDSPTSPTSAPIATFRQSLLRLAGALSATLALLAATCGYWTIVRAESLRAREDNPRRVLYEQRIVRGRILDRANIVLADVEIGEAGVVARRYPVPEVAPALGYASLRYGTGGVEAAFDTELRGKVRRDAGQAAWDDLLHRPPRGHDVQLTLDALLQTQAQQALEGYTGAVVLLDAASGEILALASSPTFDPERLDETWDILREDPAAPLVNRATQGLYQPGAALQTVILAEALRDDLVDLAAPTPDATDSIALNGSQLTCATPLAEPYFLARAYAAACPAPFTAIGEQLEGGGLTEAIQRWALTTPPPLEIPTEAADWDPRALRTPDDLRLEAIGQGKLTVTPLQMALVAATLANDGTRPTPQLALRVQDAAGHWQSGDSLGEPRTVLKSSTTNDLLATWQPHGAGISGHLSLAVAGQGQPPHAWFLGIVQAGDARYAVAILLEHPDDAHQAAEIGATLLGTTISDPTGLGR